MRNIIIMKIDNDYSLDADELVYVTKLYKDTHK